MLTTIAIAVILLVSTFLCCLIYNYESGIVIPPLNEAQRSCQLSKSQCKKAWSSALNSMNTALTQIALKHPTGWSSGVRENLFLVHITNWIEAVHGSNKSVQKLSECLTFLSLHKDKVLGRFSPFGGIYSNDKVQQNTDKETYNDI